MAKLDLKNAIKDFKNIRVLVVGDLMLDHYIYGNVERISPEAPVPVLQKTSEKYFPGGAANTALNLASLKARASVLGVVGADERKNVLLNLLKKNKVDLAGVVTDPERPTTLKQRIVAGINQIVRVDEESTQYLSTKIQNDVFNKFKIAAAKTDIIILSDYAKGFFSPGLTEKIIKFAKSKKKPILADFKASNKDLFKGVDIITPNLKEGKEISGEIEVEKIGSKIRKDYGAHVLLKRGGDGISVFHKDKNKPVHIPAKKVNVYDVSGAGDTVVAVVSLIIASGLDVYTAAMVANYAGGVIVQKVGTATLEPEELAAAFEELNRLDSVQTVPKLWGYEKWLENNEKYCCKLLSLNQGYQCSLHYHKDKDETFLILKGHVRMEVGEKVFHMYPGDFVRILPGTPHRFSGMEYSEIIETSTNHKEEDSYRLELSKKI